MSPSATIVSNAMEMIRYVAAGLGRAQVEIQSFETLEGVIDIFEYSAGTDKAFRWTTGRSEGRTRKKIMRDYRKQSDRGRDAEKSEQSSKITNSKPSSNGDYLNPEISRIIEIMSPSATVVTQAKEMIRYVASRPERVQMVIQFFKQSVGLCDIFEYRAGDVKAVRWEINRSERKTRTQILRDYRKQSDRGRDAEKSEQSSKITNSKPSSTDGGFFMPNGRKSDKVDSDYLSAVESGDMETAQKMVDEATKEAGYTVKAYHGTTITIPFGKAYPNSEPFFVFNTSENGILFGNEKQARKQKRS